MKTHMRLCRAALALVLCMGSMATAGTISGTVTSSVTSMPLLGISVRAYRWTGYSWSYQDMTATDIHGAYAVTGLPAGAYRLWFRDYHNGDYAYAIYPNAPDLASGTSVDLAEGAAVGGINVGLADAARITGVITSAADGQPLRDMYAVAHRWDGDRWFEVGYIRTIVNGSYTLGGLRAGTYRVEFDDWENQDYVREYYDQAEDVLSATDVTVSAGGTTSGINAALQRAGIIAGMIRRHGDEAPLGDILIDTHRWDGSAWQWADTTVSDEAGLYQARGLRAGTYRVLFVDRWGGQYAQQYYDGAMSPDTATSITVYSATSVGNVNAWMRRAWDADHVDMGDGWRWLDTFGFYRPMGNEGWIWHTHHGFWMIPLSAYQENVWIFTPDMGWLWTAGGVYPFLFRANDGHWLWYNGDADPRWFRNMTTEEWESWP